MRNSYADVETNSLIGSDYNPNTLTDVEFGALVAEVRDTGRLIKPVVVRDCEGKRIIVDGHFNWAAAKVVGLSTVPIEIIEADEFEARRQTLIRNLTGRKDNLLLGRVYRDMLADRDMSNRELAEAIGVSEGSIRNQLLYPQAWDLLCEEGQRADDAYVWRAILYTEATVAKLSVRSVRDLVASLQGLAGDDDDQPEAAVAEARILARLKRAWNMASEDERTQFIAWTGATADVECLVQEGRARGFAEGHDLALKAGKASSADVRSSYAAEQQANGEARNSYAERGALIKAAREERGLNAKQLAELAGVKPNYITMVEHAYVNKSGGPVAGRPVFAKIEAVLGLG